MDTAAGHSAGLRSPDRVLTKDRLAIFASAWSAMLLGSFLNFVNHNRYPMLSAEAMVIALGLLLAAVVIGYAHSRSVGSKPVLDALLVFLAVDINFSGAFAHWGGALLAMAAFVHGAIRHRSAVPFIAVIFLVVVMSQLAIALTSNASAQALRTSILPGKAALPAIVHVILDEHIGLEGLNPSDEDVSLAREKLKSSYLRNGFAVYGGAYSRHFHTTNSIPEMLNLGATELGGPPHISEEIEIETNAYFSELSRLGYRINVLQSDFVGYCQHPSVSRCQTYRRNDIEPLSRSPLSVGERASVIAAAFASLSDAIEATLTVYDFIAAHAQIRGIPLPIVKLDMLSLTSTLAALDGAQNFTLELASAEHGNAYFAHLLAPHYPHLTRADCTVKPHADWTYRSYGSSLETRKRSYADQLLCSAKLVEGMLDALARSPASQDTVVIVHGDHGSRITRLDPKIETIERLTDDDLIAGYSTLFAIRLGSAEASYNAVNAPVSNLIKQLIFNRFSFLPQTAAEDAAEMEIFLEDRDWRPVKAHRMPRFRDGQSLK